MARRSRIQMDDEGTELNMTPMLDVVFILLIFFIVTSVFVKQTGIDIFKPNAVTKEEWRPTILVAVSPNDEVWIDKTPYDVSEVRAVILALRDESPKADAIILGDTKSPAGTVMKVQNIMQDLGIRTRLSAE